MDFVIPLASLVLKIISMLDNNEHCVRLIDPALEYIHVFNTYIHRQVIIAPVSLNWFRMQGHALVKTQAMDEPIRDNISVTFVVQSRNAKPT